MEAKEFWAYVELNSSFVLRYSFVIGYFVIRPFGNVSDRIATRSVALQ
jgi:hypothetical protein